MITFMTRVDVDEARTNLSHLIESAREGEEIIIERSGRPVAKIADDFDELPEDLQRAFGMIDDCNDPL